MARGKRQRGRPAAKRHDAAQEDDRWSDATTIPLIRHGIRCCKPADPPFNTKRAAIATHDEWESPTLQVAGLGSATGTVFARIRDSAKDDENDNDKASSDPPRNRWRVEDAVETILEEISLHDAKDAASNLGEEPGSIATGSNNAAAIRERESSQSLLDLGAVWVLDPASSDRPQNKPVWKRLFTHDPDNNSCDNESNSCDPTTDAGSRFWLDQSMTVRVHTRPSRYPMARRFETALERGVGRDRTSHGGIVFEKHADDDAQQSAIMFAVLHKPFGLPSHATVDNGRENLLYLYRRYRGLDYASLPQRLDTETSGLVLVAARPAMAAYFSKLLERKTTDAAPAAVGIAEGTPTPTTTTTEGIRKRYRCLVAPREDSWEEIANVISKTYIADGTLVEHYVDAKSKAPKTFASARDFAATGGPPTAGPSKWQPCRIRVRSMRGPLAAPDVATTLPKNARCLELEVELLTGRTHQIRGQLAALGCPIVGDPLYGREPAPDSWGDRSTVKMALQCCALSFPADASAEHRASLRGEPSESANSKEGPSNRQLEFCLDSAWWRG